MSDQIIIEFIGDPSGLKPAEEALRGLGKSSQDTIAAFEKANTAAKHFAEGAKEAATAVKSTGEAAEKSVKALSSLSQAISGGAVKAVADDFKNWAKEIADLGVKKGELKQRLTEVTGEMAKAKAEINAGKESLAALTKENKATEKEINSTAAAMDKYSAMSAKAADKNIELKDKMDKARATLTGMNGTSDEGSAKYNKLVASIEKYSGEIVKNDKTITDNAARIHALGETNRDLAAKYDLVKGKIDQTNTSVATHKTALAGLTKEAGTLQTSIASVDKELAQANKSFGGQSKAAKESTESFDKLIGNSKKLVSALGDVAATTASATGSERDANNIRRKTAEVLQALTTAQTIATGATEAMTAATEIATVATTGLDVALGPVILAVGAVVAVAAAAAAQFAVMYTVGKKVVEVVEKKFHVFEKVKPVIDAVGGALSKFADKARDVISFFSGGLIEDSKLHKLNDELEKAAKKSEKLSEEYKKQGDLLEAEGMTAQSVAQKRADALKEEQKALIDHLKVETDAAKKAELRDKISKNTVDLLGQQKNAISGMADDLQKQGKSEGEILKAKEEQIAVNMKLIADEMAKKDLTEEQTTSLKAQLAAMQNMLEETGQAHKKYNQEKAKEDQASALESAKKTAELRLATAKAGSEEELKARLADMKAGTDIELNNEKLTAEQRRLIRLRLTQDTQKEIQAFYQKALEAETKDVEKGSEQEYKIKMDVLGRERAAIEHNDKLTAAQKLEMYKQVNEQEDQIWQTYMDARTAKEKAALDAIVAAARAAEKKKMDDAMAANAQTYQDDVSKEEKAIADKKEKYDRDMANANLSIKAKQQLNEQYHQSVATSLMNEMGLLQQKYTNDIAAAKGNNELLKKIGNDFLNDSKLIQDKITANRKENNKKREELDKEGAKKEEDIAKQVGQKLIEMAKQVSDAIFENQKQQRDNELKEKLDHLAAQKDAELMNTTLTAAQRKAIEKKYKMQEAREKENAWKADQKAKAEQAVINGLLAFTAALASSPPPMNYVNAAIALASAGIQAGIIMSKTPPKFAKGVVALEGPGTETSDSIPAYLSKGESVITASATRRYQPLLEAMNAGTLDRYMPLPQMPDVKTLETANRSSHRAQAEKIDYEKIGEALARRINMKQLNVTIDEKGFTKSVVRRGERITSYNDRMQF
ncbi:MAG: hypothetical protein JSS76_19600 [Bacteroidetes bacterium]|nr:hypothetical protein [Bacteroidota bacterium]